MANSYTTYAGNGVTKNFTVSFPFISRSHVKVKINGVEVPTPLYWWWVNDSTITFDIAPEQNAAIEIVRETPRTTRLVDFQNGAVLTEAELDLAHLQHFYIAQEIIDRYEALLDGGYQRIATANGISYTPATAIIDAMVQEVLADPLLATLQQSLNDIDTNAQNVIDIDARMLDLEATVDALANIDGTGIVTFIENEQTQRIAGDNALAATIALIGAKNGAETAFIIDTNTVKLDADTGDTLAAKLSALVAADSANSAAIISEQTSRINGDTAIANDVTALTTTVDGNTATIATQGTSINGLQAKYTVKVDVNGYVAGYGLAVDANTATPTSSFIILADKFAVVHPAQGLGTPKVPFVVSGGVVSMANVAIDGALINNASIGSAKIASAAITSALIQDAAITNAKIQNAAITDAKISSLSATKITTGTLNASRINLDGLTLTNNNGILQVGTVQTANIANASITNAKIGSLAVDTLKIQDNAVTVPVGNFNSSPTSVFYNSGNGGQVGSVSIDSAGQPVFLLCSFYRTRSGDDGNAYVSIKKNGVTIWGWMNTKVIDNDGRVHIMMTHYDSAPGTGTKTYTFWARPGDTNDSWSVSDVNCFALGMKK